MDPVERKESGILPLEGLTVVDMTQVVAGPFAAMMLGDLGAEVIKLEAIGRGDRSRTFPPKPWYFDLVNRNKKSVEVNLKTEEGRRVAQRILEETDVFLESSKPGRIETYDLHYPKISELNPEIIYCSIRGFGSHSPYGDLPAWDMIMQAMSGIMSITGEEDGPPLWSGLASGDLAASMYAAESVLAALFAREKGLIRGEWIEVPMLDAAISLLCVRAASAFAEGKPFPRMGTRHPIAAPFGMFQCEDGPIVIATATESLWQDFCRAIERPELIDDERFHNNDSRVENRDKLHEIINPILASRSRDSWIERLHEHGVPAGPIYDTLNVWDDKHVKQRNLRRRISRPDGTESQVIDQPVCFLNLTSELRLAPQTLGESTEDVLNGLGYSQTEIEQLREQNAIG